MRDDSQMSRFEQQGLRRFSARQALISVALAVLLLVIFSGGSIRDAGEEMDPGIGRDVVLAVGEPAGWVADRLPFADAGNELTAGLSPDEELAGGGFETATGGGPAGEVPPVTPDYFDPLAIGAKPPPKLPLETLLVTGDSLVTPLDLELGRRLAEDGVEVVRDPHLAAGISKTSLVDWGGLSAAQVERVDPDAVVMFIGANEGYPIPGPEGEEVACCGAPWAALYANRVRQVMDTYRQEGDARVYWLTIPTPRDRDLQGLTRVVNEAILVAAQPFRSQVRVIDMVPIFTPGARYRDSMPVEGEETIVRDSDGLHLNDVGSRIAADTVLERIDEDFTR